MCIYTPLFLISSFFPSTLSVTFSVVGEDLPELPAAVADGQENGQLVGHVVLLAHLPKKNCGYVYLVHMEGWPVLRMQVVSTNAFVTGIFARVTVTYTSVVANFARATVTYVSHAHHGHGSSQLG